MKKLLLLALLPIAIAALVSSCDVGSANSVVRTVEVNVSGVYAGPGGEDLVSKNSGAKISSLNLRQNGDKLEGIDNNFQIFRGTIGNVQGKLASFSLDGYTTAGNKGTLTGTIDASTTSAEMRGTWIEASMYGVIYGIATISTSSPSPGVDLKINSPNTVTMKVGDTTNFTASGGSDYKWSISNPTLGESDQEDGSTFQYKAITNGTQTITVTSGGKTVSVTVTQNNPASTTGVEINSSDGSILATVGAYTTLTATNGKPPYKWSKEPDDLGEFTSDTGSPIKYTRFATSGKVKITVKDDSNDSDSIEITQN